jgi:formylglycine-generating enzyme required for sulfatase activity
MPAEWGTGPTENNVDWNNVSIVPDSTGYRLPTEAQWEYACRAGTTTAYYTGAAASDGVGWYNSNSSSRTHEVGKKPPNPWGLYDMHGNVWEWCQDRNVSQYPNDPQTDPPADPAAGSDNRITRGGSYAKADWNMRSAMRFSDEPAYKQGVEWGFRLVLPLP